MNRFYVVTPPVGCVDVVTDEGQGPWVEECDVILIEAETPKDAIALGVREMLNGPRRQYHYCRDQRADKRSPYAGVRAVLDTEHP